MLRSLPGGPGKTEEGQEGCLGGIPLQVGLTYSLQNRVGLNALKSHQKRHRILKAYFGDQGEQKGV